MSAWHSVTVGVADLRAAHRLWIQLFGFEERQDWLTHSELELRWGTEPGSIRDSLLVAAPGTECGWVRLVRFNTPGEPVRAAAEPWDLCAKNLDVRVDDLPARLPALAKACLLYTSDAADE